MIDEGARDLKGRMVKGAAGAQQAAAHLVSATGNVPLRIKGVPDAVCDVVGIWNGGIAGAMLGVWRLLFLWDQEGL